MSTIVLAVLLVGTTPQLPLSVAATDDALAAFANPAGLGVGRQFDFYYLYSLRHGNLLVNSSFCAGIGPLGAYWEPRPSRWGVALGAGGGGFYSGVKLHRDSVSRWDAGALWRPANWLSVGAVWQDLGHSWGAVLTGIALRPLGSRYTLSGEAYVDDPTAPFLGLAAEPFDGIGLSGRVRLGATVNFTAGLTVGLGNFSLGAVRTHRPAEYGGYVRIGSETRRSLLPRAKCYLDVRLAQPVQDRKPGFSLMGPGAVRTTWRLLEMLHEAEEDASVRGLLLRLQGSAMSFAHAQELRAALASFRARGKKVVVHAHNLGMGGCYLASAADRVAVHPLADVSIPGISATTAFLKGTLEKLGIKAQPTRHGTYKSAVEAFTEDSLSPTNREQVEGLVRGMYTEWVDAVGAGRGRSTAEVESLVDVGFLTAEDAKAAGLVDTTCYDDELDSILRRDLAGLRRVPERSFVGRDEFEYDWRRPEATVAVVYASGAIRTGESGTDFLSGDAQMGSATMVRAIRQARDNRNTRAVVLRVDSPGGDGFASDLIWRELELCRRKKPVVVSMAGVAASGGYYISCGADRIYALPGTVTGSIGVFSLSFVTGGLYNKLGIRRQTVKRGEHADMGELREMTPAEDSMVQAMVDRFYDQFVRKVADGRHLSLAHVDSVGQGRVWTGRDALAAGLVDSLGGFRQAVDYARARAGLRDCELEFYPKPRPRLRSLFREGLTDLLLSLRLW